MIALRNFGITFLVAAIVFGLLAVFVAPMVVQSFSGGFTEDGEAAEGSGDNGEAESSTSSEDALDLSTVNGASFTVMLVGVDYLPDNLGDYGTTFAASYTYGEALPTGNLSDEVLTYRKTRKISADSILLVRVDRETKSFVFLSVPGNTRVSVDGNYTRLGSVLTAKGISFFRNKVTALTGLPIDYYVLFTPKGFTNAINTLGGVSFDVPQAMSYEDPVEGLTISLAPGQQTLGGRAALSMLRYVGYTDGDTGRMQTARKFARQILANREQYATLANATELFTTVSSFIYSDMTVAQFQSEADLIFCYDKMESVEVAYPGQSIVLDGESYFEPDAAAATEMMKPYR